LVLQSPDNPGMVDSGDPWDYEKVFETADVSADSGAVAIKAEGERFRLNTPDTYQLPLKIEVRAKTDGSSLRLFFNNGSVTFNDNPNRATLRVQDVMTGVFGGYAYGFVEPDEFHDITWIIGTTYTAVAVNGKIILNTDDLFYIQALANGTATDLTGFAGVGSAWGSTVTVESMTVTELR
jgi:hypothetical protein